MSEALNSVVVTKNATGAWEATHVPSGKSVTGNSPADAQDGMRRLLGMDDHGSFQEPTTSGSFSGVAQAIALFLEGPVSEALSYHSGWARLSSYQDGVAQVRLGGGCEGCPSSQITLFNGVKTQLQSRFGEDVVVDVIPVVVD